jgi:hypothetical protein
MSVFPAGGGFDPRAFIQDFRASYVNLYVLWRRGASAPSGAEVHTPAERPLSVDALPDDLRRAAKEIAGERRSIELLKYLRTEDGRPTELVEDEQGLPPEESLVTLTRTISAVGADSGRVVTEVYAGRWSDARDAAS